MGPPPGHATLLRMRAITALLLLLVTFGCVTVPPAPTGPTRYEALSAVVIGDTMDSVLDRAGHPDDYMRHYEARGRAEAFIYHEGRREVTVYFVNGAVVAVTIH